MRTAFFAGSFDPFTLGHKDIADRGLALFDRLIIGIGYNEHKASARRSPEERLRAIEAIYAGDERVTVMLYTGLTAEVARKAGACCLLRGVRDTRDFEYEKSIADTNRCMFGLDTVLLFCDPAVSFVSASMVRELENNGCDVSRFIPCPKEKD